jgi:hypothetical protein
MPMATATTVLPVATAGYFDLAAALTALKKIDKATKYTKKTLNLNPYYILAKAFLKTLDSIQ